MAYVEVGESVVEECVYHLIDLIVVEVGGVIANYR